MLMDAKFNVIALRDAICKAKDAAHALLNDYPDNGTFNFDTPAIELPDGIDLCELQGKDSSLWNGFTLERISSPSWKGWYWINGICNGMQMRRTKQAEAVANSLREQGYESYVYYQMD